MMTFSKSFTDRLTSEFVVKLSLNIPPHLKYVATLLCELSVLKKVDMLKT